MKRIALLVFAFLVIGSLSLAAAKTITGTVSDSGCGLKHAVASDAAAGCVEHCVSSGKTYVLVSNGKIYQLDAQDKFKGLGGKSVTVTGTVKGTNITVAGVAEKSM
jgi:uncharacterized heparinase superfamily protein